MNAQPLAGLLVVSDMDNTLLREDIGLPPQNLQALQRFCALGGSFTVATGRNVPAIRRYLGQLPINAPVILLNGGLIYDYKKELALSQHFIPREKALQALRRLMLRFPELGVEIMAENLATYVVRANAYTARHLEQERFSAVLADETKLTGEWFKVLFAGSPADCLAAEKYSRKAFAQEKELIFQRTQDCYFEILPAGIHKGTALQSLCRILGVPSQASYAIGDFDNDIGLLKASGFAVAVGNAPARVQRAADFVTGTCAEGGVAQFLNVLMEFKTQK